MHPLTPLQPACRRLWLSSTQRKPCSSPCRARDVTHRRLVSQTAPRRKDQAELPEIASKEGVEAVAKLKPESPIPLLQRPLGVPERPSSLPQSWEQKREELLDQEKRLKKRHELVREATKGYFTDLNATRRHGGKTWVAPKTMIREDKALYFPDIVGTNLHSKAGVHTTSLCTGKVSVVAMLTTRVSEVTASANYIKPTHEQYSSHPMYRYIQINLQENLLKSLLVSLFTSGIRKSIPEELWESYLVSNQNMDYVRHDMGMTNSRIGYVFLVDEQCKIRWAACADPINEEIEALRVCTGVLLNRYNKGPDVVAS
ncbi:ATP10 protein-domain-containing protein [Fomitopsis serialis]|uniref:ATP10 protein-domain-containing protein n=1 Tax=Fomitopsis serialis TaxID=139415 RepID=UPI002007B660|nr:ATP10 protein-domain-containing protein [Neoantrodia serialis]KAH9917170.1 ATP10 protein-domain-containing protein [Neoantrodia serialis]